MKYMLFGAGVVGAYLVIGALALVLGVSIHRLVRSGIVPSRLHRVKVKLRNVRAAWFCRAYSDTVQVGISDAERFANGEPTWRQS